MTDAPARRVLGDRNDKHGRHDGRGSDWRRGAVDERRPLRRDRAFAPQPPQLTVRLERARSAPSLEARFPVLHETWQERSERKTTDELHNSGNHHLVVHPITPTRAAASSTTTRPIR